MREELRVVVFLWLVSRKQKEQIRQLRARKTKENTFVLKQCAREERFLEACVLREAIVGDASLL